MGWIRFIVNDREMPPPTAVNWQSPNVLGATMLGEPVIGAGWRCTVSYGLSIEPWLIDQFMELVGERIRFTISPSPFNLCDDCQLEGAVTGIGVRYAQDAIAGIDVEINYIVQTVGIGG